MTYSKPEPGPIQFTSEEKIWGLNNSDCADTFMVEISIIRGRAATQGFTEFSLCIP